MDALDLVATLAFGTLFAAVGMGIAGQRGAKRAKQGAADDSTLGQSAEVSRDPSDRLLSGQEEK